MTFTNSVPSPNEQAKAVRFKLAGGFSRRYSIIVTGNKRVEQSPTTTCIQEQRFPTVEQRFPSEDATPSADLTATSIHVRPSDIIIIPWSSTNFHSGATVVTRNFPASFQLEPRSPHCPYLPDLGALPPSPTPQCATSTRDNARWQSQLHWYYWLDI